MEKIVLEVNDDFARKWNSTTEPERDKVLSILNNALDLIEKQEKKTAPAKGYGLPGNDAIGEFKKATEDSRCAYEQSLEQLRKKAKNNGLTEEILERLLNE